MPARLVWRPQARQDLLDVYATAAAADPVAAERLLDAFEARSRRLAEHPRLGPRRPEIGAGARMLVVRVVLLLYEVHPDSDAGPVDSVSIVRVVDGRRDLRRLFG